MASSEPMMAEMLITIQYQSRLFPADQAKTLYAANPIITICTIIISGKNVRKSGLVSTV